MAVGDDQFFILHRSLHFRDQLRITHRPQRMDDSVFIGNGDFRARVGGEQGIDLPGILIKHEDLAEVRPRGPQQIEAVGLGFRQGLLVAKDYAGGIILDAAQSDKAAPLQLGARARSAKALGVSVD